MTTYLDEQIAIAETVPNLVIAESHNPSQFISRRLAELRALKLAYKSLKGIENEMCSFFTEEVEQTFYDALAAIEELWK